MSIDLNNIAWRPYQDKCKRAIKTRFDAGITKQLIVSATGTGKRIMSVDIMRHFNRSLFVAHREELIMQAYNEIDGFWPMHAGIVKGSHFEIDKRIVVASVQTLTNRLDKMDPGMFDFIVLDESHHYTAPSFLRVVRHFKPRLLTGWTATPKRLDGISLSNIFEEIVFQYNIRQGIQEGFLAPIEAYQIKTQSDLSGVKKTAGDFNLMQLAEKVDTELRNNLVVMKYRQYAEGRPAVAFCVDMDHAYHLRDEFRKYGYRAETVVSDVNRCPNRKEILQMFAEGQTDIVTNVNILTEGYDFSDIGCVLEACPTQSETKYTQGIGRGTRLKSVGYINRIGDDKCIILDFVDNTKLPIVNSYELEKDQEIENRMFVPQAVKELLIAEREKRVRKHIFAQGKDAAINLLPEVHAWESEKMLDPATEKQIDWLKRENIWEEGNEYTKKQASELISNLPCKSWQIVELANWKYDVTRGATLGQYQRVKALLGQRDKFKIPQAETNRAMKNMSM